MKVLVHIKVVEGREVELVCYDTSNNKVKEYTVAQLLKAKEEEPKLLIDGVVFNGKEIKVENSPKYEKKALYVISMLAEGTSNEKKKVVGYKVYDPEVGRLTSLPVSMAVDKVKLNGAINADIRTAGTQQYLYAKVKTEPAYRNVGLYLKLYHCRRNIALARNRPCEKIVRVDEHNLELRSIPTGSYERMVTPKGVSYINLKWWKIVGPKHMLFQTKPKVNELVLGESVKKILYNYPPNDMDLVPENISLGCFAGWGLKKVTLSSKLNVIGQEAFIGNKIEELSIPPCVWEIEKSAFQNIGIEKLEFETREPNKKGVITELTIGDSAFAGNPLTQTEYLRLPPIKSLGVNAFKGTKITGVHFDKAGSIRVIRKGTFANTQIEEFYVPNSVQIIEAGAFSGTPIRRLIFNTGTQIKTIDRDFAGKANVRIIGTKVRPK